MKNVFVSVDGIGKHFDEDYLLSYGEDIKIEKVSEKNYWVSIGEVGFHFNSEDRLENMLIEVDGEPLGEFIDRKDI